MVKHVTSAELEEVVASGKTVFCDFWASWCGPCRMLAPVFEAVAQKYEGQAKFVKVDVDEEESAAVKYGISSIPNVIVFKKGKAVANNLGFMPTEAFENFVKSNL